MKNFHPLSFIGGLISGAIILALLMFGLQLAGMNRFLSGPRPTGPAGGRFPMNGIERGTGDTNRRSRDENGGTLRPGFDASMGTKTQAVPPEAGSGAIQTLPSSPENTSSPSVQ